MLQDNLNSIVKALSVLSIEFTLIGYERGLWNIMTELTVVIQLAKQSKTKVDTSEAQRLYSRLNKMFVDKL